MQCRNCARADSMHHKAVAITATPAQTTATPTSLPTLPLLEATPRACLYYLSFKVSRITLSRRPRLDIVCIAMVWECCVGLRLAKRIIFASRLFYSIFPSRHSPSTVSHRVSFTYSSAIVSIWYLLCELLRYGVRWAWVKYGLYVPSIWSYICFDLYEICYMIGLNSATWMYILNLICARCQRTRKVRLVNLFLYVFFVCPNSISRTLAL